MSTPVQIRDRVVEFRRVPASELVPNPKNWRTHPQGQQDALGGVLAEIGFAGAVLTRTLPDGRLMLIDGHLRTETAGDLPVPVLVTDLSEAEADLLLATYDPLSAMAGTDGARLRELTDAATVSQPAVKALLSQLKLDAEKALAKIQPPVPPSEFPEVNEGVHTDHACPNCGYRWSGKAG